MKLTAYLLFNGQAEQAAEFYAQTLGGTIQNLFRYHQMPPMPGWEVPAEYGQKVGHCCVMFPGGSLSVADTPPSDPRSFTGHGHVLSLSVDSVEQAELIFGKLCADALKVPCPMGEVFYAKRYGEVVDRFGVLWAVMYEEKK